MYLINSFLQKRKVHENQHGILMVITAYVLSFIMLVLGSDIFYDINSEAAGIAMDTDEEAQEITNVELLVYQSDIPATQILQSNLINPYGVTDVTGFEGARTQNSSTGDETVWLLGSAMNETQYDSFIEQLSVLNILSINEGETIVDASAEIINDKTSNSIVAETKNKTKKDIESLSSAKTASPYIMNVTNSEIEMLERIVEAEAGGEDIKGKILIANVVFNRIEDEDFPDTIKGVIFHKVQGDYQFSPVSDERYWSVKVTKETKKAVERALEGEDYSEGALYFIARNRTNTSSARWFDQHLDWLFKHGGHEFYKNK